MVQFERFPIRQFIDNSKKIVDNSFTT